MAGHAKSRTSARKRNKSAEKEVLLMQVMKYLLAGYLLFLTMIYPFICTREYILVSVKKWNFFKGITWYFDLNGIYIPGFITLMVITALLYGGSVLFKGSRQGGIRKPGSEKIKMLSSVDKLVLMYLIFVLLSSVLSEYKSEIIWGYRSWYMGFMSQLAFVLIYFFISRLFITDDLGIYVYILLAVTTTIFLIAVLQRLGYDPFSLYGDMERRRRLYFLSTIGQTTWYSAYMSLFLPVSACLYFGDHVRGRKKAVLTGCLVISGMTFVSQNSDSAYLAFAGFMAVLFALSFEDNLKMERFLELTLIYIASWRLMGLMQRAAKEKAVLPDKLSLFFSQGALMWLVLAGVLLIYVLFKKNDKNFDIARFKTIRTVVLGLAIGAAILIAVYIVLNTLDKLPEDIKSKNNYLLFDMNWGHYRGAIWGDTVRSWLMCLKAEPIKAIFGTGPDAFYHIIQDYFSDNVRAVASGATGGYSDAILTNAHNEWLTAFVNMGIFGGLAYMGIFAAAFIRLIRHSQVHGVCIAAAMSIIAYFLHNLFCYQQYVATPFVFALTGVGECFIRRMGHARD